ncbi:hypothetical protein M378DRAFT_165244 [Amanita muscaria Koide BX008]|uniref:Uncharacterized protein n=1 Tax=Amanita muscaria (strain Koide BX008) TaxID=946122 RepID=A0A0C2X236_AMAMK|nr:hypothetical protein M378DRAFT_165244 [Amanita muscaria Koide BX008]
MYLPCSPRLRGPPVQQLVVRHPINGVVQLPSPHAQNSTSPRPERREGNLLDFLVPIPLLNRCRQRATCKRMLCGARWNPLDFSAPILPPAGNLQAYAKNGGLPFLTAATVNGPTVPNDRLRKDATTVKPVPSSRRDTPPWS